MELGILEVIIASIMLVTITGCEIPDERQDFCNSHGMELEIRTIGYNQCCRIENSTAYCKPFDRIGNQYAFVSNEQDIKEKSIKDGAIATALGYLIVK